MPVICILVNMYYCMINHKKLRLSTKKKRSIKKSDKL